MVCGSECAVRSRGAAAVRGSRDVGPVRRDGPCSAGDARGRGWQGEAGRARPVGRRRRGEADRSPGLEERAALSTVFGRFGSCTSYRGRKRMGTGRFLPRSPVRAGHCPQLGHSRLRRRGGGARLASGARLATGSPFATASRLAIASPIASHIAGVSPLRNENDLRRPAHTYEASSIGSASGSCACRPTATGASAPSGSGATGRPEKALAPVAGRTAVDASPFA